MSRIGPHVITGLVLCRLSYHAISPHVMSSLLLSFHAACRALSCHVSTVMSHDVMSLVAMPCNVALRTPPVACSVSCAYLGVLSVASLMFPQVLAAVAYVQVEMERRDLVSYVELKDEVSQLRR